MAEPADTVSQSEADGAERTTLKDVVQMIGELTKQVKSLELRPPPTNLPAELPRTRTAKEILAGMKPGESRSGQDRIDSTRGFRVFQPNDIFELIDEDKLKSMRAGHKLDASEPVYGVIQAFMYRRRRDGIPKYRVDFGKGIGDDGLMEDQMKKVAA